MTSVATFTPNLSSHSPIKLTPTFFKNNLMFERHLYYNTQKFMLNYALFSLFSLLSEILLLLITISALSHRFWHAIISQQSHKHQPSSASWPMRRLHARLGRVGYWQRRLIYKHPCVLVYYKNMKSANQAIRSALKITAAKIGCYF